MIIYFIWFLRIIFHTLDHQYFCFFLLDFKKNLIVPFTWFILFFIHDKNTVKERLNWSSGKIHCRITFICISIHTYYWLSKSVTKHQTGPLKTRWNWTKYSSCSLTDRILMSDNPVDFIADQINAFVRFGLYIMI